MEIASAAHPVPAAVHPEPAAPGEAQILSMDEFMASRTQTQSTPASQSAKAQPAGQPRALAARSSKYTIELNEKGQALGIPRPDFVYSGESLDGWSVKTEFLGQELVVEGPCGSKKEAKEKLSEKALNLLLELEKAGKFETRPRMKKQKIEIEPSPVRQQDKDPVNYIGQLLGAYGILLTFRVMAEFHRSTCTPQPTFTDFQLGTVFSCELTLDKHDTPFGSRTTYFTSKKAARQHAASCAIAHFESLNLWPESSTNVGGIKKKKPPTTTTPAKPTPEPTTQPTTDDPEKQKQPSVALQRPSSRSPPRLPTVSCTFKDAGPLAGPIGEVRHVFGRKKAKEECARLTLDYLEALQAERIARAKAVARGEAGGVESRADSGWGDVAEDAVVKGKAQRPVDEALDRNGESDDDDDDDDDDGFVDAVESVE
ncbi:hypothetical protein N0V90_009107 [Kalmusia sp. IMI 367209]|nr:hypothetical protein N0V90_009107 [Kalmusia sp. IMI 367209]